MDNTPRKAVAIYIRVSTTHQIDKDSLPMQRKDLVAYSELVLGIKDCVIFEDAGYSGKNTARPKFQEMMVKIRQGLFSHVLVWKIDRISRNLLDFSSMYKELKDLGVIFVSKNEQFDTSTAMGEAMLKIILVFAELERNMTSERVSATMISRASSGLWNGGRIPFGYDYNFDTGEFSINEEESKVVVLIHDLYEKFRSLIKEARYMNDNEYRTRTGNLWSATTILIILKNVFYTGDYRYNVLKEGNRQKPKPSTEWVTIENHHPAIISKAQKERISAILKENLRLNKEHNLYHASKNVHIFGNVTFCAMCNKPLGGSKERSKDTHQSRYTCPTKRIKNNACDSISVTDLSLGEFIFNFMLNMMKAKKAMSDNPTASQDEITGILLRGLNFGGHIALSDDSVKDFISALSITPKKSVFLSFRKRKTSTEKKRENLRDKRKRYERALERLTDLYLYSETTMPERDFLIKKTNIEKQIDEIDDELRIENAPSSQNYISDEELAEKAGAFILKNELEGRNYVSYKRLASTIDEKVLRSFILSTIERITVSKGKIISIIFRNGIEADFIYSDL